MNTQTKAPNASTTPEKTALLQHQQKITDAENSLANLQRSIDAQEALIADKKAQLPDVAALELRRKDMLAEVALGRQPDTAVDKLDKAVVEARALLATLHPVIKRAQETIEGLQRLHTTEEQALQLLQGATARFQRQFLLSEAEAEGALYVLEALQLAERYKRLRSMALMLQDLQYLPHLASLGPWLHIPSFELEAVKPYATNIHKNAVVAEPLNAGEVHGWRAQLSRQLQAQGLDIA